MSGLTRWFRRSFKIPNARSHGASGGEPRNEQRGSFEQGNGRSHGASSAESRNEQSQSLQKEKGVKSNCQQCEQNELEQRESLAEMDKFYKQKLNETRYVLKQKEGELKLLKHRMAEMETFYKEKLSETRSTLKLKEEEVKVKYRRNVKKQRQKSSCKQCERSELYYKESLAELETFYKAKLNEARHSIPEIQSFYKQQLSVFRSALRQKEEELKSFKDRMAADLTSSIETGDTENMSNPVSQTRLTKMYDKLKLQQWPKVKDCLKKNNGSSQTARAVIQKWFQEAAEHMERRKKHIDEAFSLIQDNKGPKHQKVKEYRQLTVQNLQLALYHSSREHDQISLPECEGQYTQDVVERFRHLVSECYWLGCLMALNRPPLRPDWENHVRGMDSWDIFPRDITTVTVV